MSKPKSASEAARMLAHLRNKKLSPERRMEISRMGSRARRAQAKRKRDGEPTTESPTEPQEKA